MKKPKKEKEKRKYRPLPEGPLTIEILAREFSITNNKKVGVCVDMPAVVACPGATEACTSPFIRKDGSESETSKKCYATLPPYVWSQPIYQRNMDLITLGIEQLGVMGTAKALSLALMEVAFLVEKIRLHGSGDIWSWAYCQVLVELCKLMPEKTFWLYTRSWRVPTLLPAIIELARLPNVYVNLSLDYVNFEEGADVFLAHPGVFHNIAIMQRPADTWPLTLVERGVLPSQLVTFPEHKRVKDFKMPAALAGPVCPAMSGKFKLEKVPACLQCKASMCNGK